LFATSSFQLLFQIWQQELYYVRRKTFKRLYELDADALPYIGDAPTIVALLQWFIPFYPDARSG
jgi:hypothetical protein